jgi:hypothetical protein
LAAGHKVTAFVSGATQYKKANVRVVAGDVLDAAAVDVALAGQDAVIDALGGKTPWKVTTMETSAAHNIVDAMRRNGVRRLLKISVVGAGESVKNAGFFNEHVLMRTFLRGLLVDKAGMEAEIEGSNLDSFSVRCIRSWRPFCCGRPCLNPLMHDPELHPAKRELRQP